VFAAFVHADAHVGVNDLVLVGRGKDFDDGGRRRAAVDVDERRLWTVVDGAFSQRRKTIRNALRRLGVPAADADRALAKAGIEPAARPETLDLAAFARVAEAVQA